MKSNFVANLFVVIVVSMLFGACGLLKSPNAPSPPSQVPNIPPGTTIHEVPLPGTSVPFRWWLATLDPAKNSQLVAGQQYRIGISCDAPDGYSFFLRGEFTSGPGTSPIYPDGNGIYGEAGDTNGCGGNKSSGGATATPRTPDLPYFRFSVWVAPGRGGFGGNQPDRPPDIVVDEPIGWRHPE